MADLRPLFDFNMLNNWKIRPDSYTTTMEQNVQFQVGIYHEKFNLIKFKMADLWPLLTPICVITGKPCQIARPLLLNNAANNQFSDNLNNNFNF